MKKNKGVPPPPHLNFSGPCEKLKKKQENEPWNWSNRNTTPTLSLLVKIFWMSPSPLLSKIKCYVIRKCLRGAFIVNIKATAKCLCSQENAQLNSNAKTCIHAWTRTVHSVLPIQNNGVRLLNEIHFTFISVCFVLLFFLNSARMDTIYAIC